MIDVQHATYTYPRADGRPAVDDVSLTIPGGAFIALLGANGSGKSTLARLLNGLLVPQSGSVIVDGYNTGDPAAARIVRQTVGMVLQNPDNQIVSTTVEHDVAFGLENYCIDPALMRGRVRQALAAVGLAGRELDNPHDLSASQKQLLAVAGALAVQSHYLVLDEATSSLDGADRQDVLGAVVRLHEQNGLGIILITHLMEEALRADHVIVMSQGQVVFEGEPGAVFSRAADQLHAWSLEVPPLTQFAAALHQRGVPLQGISTSSNELVEQLCQLPLKT